MFSMIVFIHITFFVKDVLSYSTSTPRKLLFTLQYPIQSNIIQSNIILSNIISTLKHVITKY